MSEIKWQEPPTTKRSAPRVRSKWVAIGDALRSSPGRWALVHVGSAAAVTHIKKGSYQIGPGVFEATGRKRPDGKWDVYARFVGGAE